MSSEMDATPIELHMFSPISSSEPVELLVATAHFHKTGARLHLNNTINFGKSWMDDSICVYGLISLPYLDGPKLENMDMCSGRIAKYYWLIPITKAEVDYKITNGIDKLEALFEKYNIDYVNPKRESVC
jgi:hypothetical protein